MWKKVLRQRDAGADSGTTGPVGSGTLAQCSEMATPKARESTASTANAAFAKKYFLKKWMFSHKIHLYINKS